MPRQTKAKVSTRVQRKPIECRDIDRAFQEPMAPVPTSFSYSLSLVIVAVIMFLLPLSYLALIGGIGWYVYDQYQLHGAIGISGWIALLVMFFLIKPVFSHQRYEYKPITLERDREPIFFAYIDRICDVTGAPRPKRINIDCNLNAAASFHRGFLSFFNKDLDLHLGLPLIVGLDIRQLTGVLSHEFGHFSQNYAMRAGYVIQRVNMWFERVVFQRDGFDYFLERMAGFFGRIHIIPGLFMLFIRFLIGTSRFVLWLLMHVAHLCSSLLSRQMEFNADRHAMNMVGNSDFINALKFIPIIDYAQQGAQQHLFQAWREKRLGDNIPALIYNNIKRIPQDVQKKLMNQGMTSNTSLYDSHPSTVDRIRISMDNISKGVLRIDRRPASDLFRHFEGICKEVTLALYTDGLEIDIKSNTLIETSQLIANVEQEEANAAARLRYFQGQWAYNPLFPMKKYTISGDVSMDKLQRELSRSHASFQQQVDALVDLGNRLDALDNRIITLQDALLLKRSGFSFEPAALQVDADTSEAIQSALSATRAEHRELCEQLTPYADTLIKRMAVSWKMLQHPTAEALVENIAATRADYRKARDCMIDLAQHIHLITDLRYHWCGLQRMVNHLESQYENHLFMEAAGQQLSLARCDLINIQQALQETPYPYEHAAGTDLSIAAYLIDRIPEDDDADGIFQGSEQCIAHFMALYQRVTGIIAITGEAMEELCDLPQIPYAQDDEDLPD